jgi:hypothetical protein
MFALSDPAIAMTTPGPNPGSAPSRLRTDRGKSEAEAMGRVLQLGETGLMVYALRTFGWVRAAQQRLRPHQNGFVRPGARCGGVAEWLKAHSAPKARVPSRKTACAPACAAEGWPSG